MRGRFCFHNINMAQKSKLETDNCVRHKLELVKLGREIEDCLQRHGCSFKGRKFSKFEVNMRNSQRVCNIGSCNTAHDGQTGNVNFFLRTLYEAVWNSGKTAWPTPCYTV